MWLKANWKTVTAIGVGVVATGTAIYMAVKNSKLKKQLGELTEKVKQLTAGSTTPTTETASATATATAPAN